ncbi:glucose-specific PTS transporter subunit IIBC [Clostridium tertium]|jgi:PTS system D-glucosamine-specific IIC component|uniref:glucose-specific PTS transporter subunit IIBC n=1 Tax=Clostridium tertium TaxID=1559 RepID=UPI000BE257BC|nr:glucose-specific PTS transporter subunit IIBC [Clostridium tertium]MDU8965661.1 glucose-specific PTS transporter subunit IIBC [Clostridium sp.]MBU6136777.1 glucose-specific PTS transporter subunit IIBC [Clostridium tertium]MDB1940928.1 glucose-specific PTS transporter subunit IIBC [Clostridium tertium]MDB1947268.1 glucose-specific PTS transporter subunit IIBC [Clostridium tertium]MDB1955632.1 glucose-specific PTS transporter subunit IIBC [Clostridium tertium]
MNTIFLKKYFGVLQRVGKSLMLPVALLPAAGLLMGIGTLLQNPNIINNIPMLSGETFQLMANIMSSSGDIVFSNLPLIFAVGVAIGMSNGDGVAALAAIVSFLIMNMTIGITARVDLLQVDTNPMYDMVLGIPTLQTGVFGGILIGMVSAIIYQKFYTIKLPEFLGFFSGKRFVPIVAAIAGVLIGIIMVVIWPPIQNFLLAFSRSMIGTNQTVSALIFGIVERALIPFGLHHIWYNPFWYQFGEYTNLAGQLVVGDQAIFFAQLKEGVEFTAGTFMTGKFPFMMFGLPAAALAMYHEADSDKKKLVAGILFSGALTSFLTGITEPIEFMFLFVAPVLFGVHCIFAGLSFMIMQILNVKVGLTFSGGLIDFILFGVLPNRTKWWWIIIVGIIFAAIYYIGFRYIIRKLDLKTPGREREESEIDIDITDGDLAYNVLDAFGGVKNIKYLDACITRVRVTVKNISLVNRSKLKSLGSADLMIIGDNIQAIFGPKSDMLKEQMKDIIDGKEVKVKKKKNIEKIEKGLKIESSIMMPVTGKLLRLEEVPDPIFSMKLIGDGFAIDPKKNILISPIKGMILTISKTSHSITIRGLDGFDIFIHIGIDSINLNGNGFKAFVQEGDIVNEGDLLIEFPLDEIREKLKSPMIPVIFKGLSKEKFIYFNNDIDVKSGDINKVEIHEKLNN